LRSVIGDLIKLDPIRPSQLLANSLPRNGAEHTREFKFLRVSARKRHGERHREIRGERIDPPINPDGFHREGIFEGEHAAAALKTRDCGDTVVNAIRRELRAGLSLFTSRPTATTGAPMPSRVVRSVT
jgi:hypothetical protein